MTNGDRPSLDTLGDRVWWAWNCLPRERGKPPSWKGLEKRHAIGGATFSKLADGSRTFVGSDTLPKLADALNVSVAWLLSREGPDPVPTGTMMGRGADKYVEAGPDAMVRKYAAIGPVVPGAPNPFQAAVFYVGTDIDADIVEEVAALARGVEGSRTPQGWGRELIDRQRARSETKAQTKMAASARRRKPKLASVEKRRVG